MASFFNSIAEAEKKEAGYWGKRIISELKYAAEVSGVNNGQYDDAVGDAAKTLVQRQEENGAVTRRTAMMVEDILSPVSCAAKGYTVLCAAHAHIDMNWMWGYNETVAVTLDTFRTMLSFMIEYPEFSFSQSQASVYRIIEEHDPSMLEEIKERVKEGRWEVTASTWVETDKNMPDGESLARHILYTKNYLAEIFGLDKDSLDIDFEPDTFGHNLNVPEILNNGGVKYYYHCRGYEKHSIYSWQSPSGKSVVVYREPDWYNARIEPDMVLHVPGFCTKHGLKTALKVYGVGDHGGGPTRRDIERICDMMTWPVYPVIRFGTFGGYFGELESVRESLPVEKNELNFIFPGCYTTQTRIKMANRTAEARLNDAERFCALGCLFAGGKYEGERFEKAWRNVLFNQFHDILPGSGVIETREYAMGLFQKTMASAGTETARVLRSISARIDTSGLFTGKEDIKSSISEGAGVGYGTESYLVPQTERGSGKTRVFHMFNPAAFERETCVELAVWDWEGSIDRIRVRDEAGRELKWQVLKNEKIQYWDSRYWGHAYVRLLVYAKVPACGYTTCILEERDAGEISGKKIESPRLEQVEEPVLENENIKAVFDRTNGSLISLVDINTGREMINPDSNAVFRFIEEDDSRGMTAWVTGNYVNITPLEDNTRITEVKNNGSLIRQWISYETRFKNSLLKVTVSLDKNSSSLDYNVSCQWREFGQKGSNIPQLSFCLPLSYSCKCYRYDIPFGTIERGGMNMDVPANSWAAAVPSNPGQPAARVVTDSKYGFRCIDNSISVTLIRSSYDPDPYPEIGEHRFRFCIDMVDTATNSDMINSAYAWNHPVSFQSAAAHEGSMALTDSFMKLMEGSVVLSAVKMSETGNRLIVRVYETEGKDTKAAVRFGKDIKSICYVDINESKTESGKKIESKGTVALFEVEAHSISTVSIEF